ncbi:Separase [Camellia lanceoleosa]|uniref:Separase n=1 Tax=Camellia lanceoleosa TaxID=1840588 RepID=A0ACC0GU41_9ERIC|nr:Separase [Camellia lanceoleosa]
MHQDASNDASKALKLCCTASWTCVSYLCEVFVNKSNRFGSDVSEDAVANLVSEIECKLCKDPDTEHMHSATSLYSLLSSSAKVSKRSLGEPLAYNEMSALSPRLCQKMQMDIIAVLLEEVYVSDDSRLQKSKILIAKGRELGACGIEGLNDCIQCLSEAISTMVSKLEFLLPTPTQQICNYFFSPSGFGYVIDMNQLPIQNGMNGEAV